MSVIQNRKCKHWNHRRNPELEQALFEAQGGACPICGKPATVLDGSYRTGKPRGWLCNTCNAGLGYFRDSPTRLRKAIAYLERPPIKALLAKQAA